MGRIYRTRRAGIDATTIWSYIAERSFPSADSWLESVDEKLRLLAANPTMGERVDHLRAGARRVTVGNFVLYFEPVNNGIRLLRIVHSARQIDDLFENLGEPS
jgi:toxin ParE1/3/4